MKLLKYVVLAALGYGLYRLVDQYLHQAAQKPTRTTRASSAAGGRRVTGRAGTGTRATTHGSKGQATPTVVGRGVVSRTTS